MKKDPITVQTTVNAPIATAWTSWTEPAHIMQWNHASDDWHCPASTNDARTGGKFSATMAAKDGSFSFDFAGEYANVVPQQLIEYTMADGRNVKITFTEEDGRTTVTETFDPEAENDVEMQRGGWQAIMDNYKKHTESL